MNFKNIERAFLIITPLFLTACVSPTPTGLYGDEPPPPTKVEFYKSCEDFDVSASGKSVFIEFDASPQLTKQLNDQLSKSSVKVTTNKDQADLQFLVTSRFVAVKPASKRMAYFEKLGLYVEDPNKVIHTQLPGKKGWVLDFTNPLGTLVGFVSGNVGANLGSKKAAKNTFPWTQGEGNLPDVPCRISQKQPCSGYIFKQHLETTLTEQKSGKSCIIDSNTSYYRIEPELLYPDHINVITKTILR